METSSISAASDAYELLRTAVERGFLPAIQVLAQCGIATRQPEAEIISWLKLAIAANDNLWENKLNCAFLLGKLLSAKKRNIDLALEFLIAGAPLQKLYINTGLPFCQANLRKSVFRKSVHRCEPLIISILVSK